MANEYPSIRIFLADDHAMIRAGLKSLIENHTGMEVVGEAGSGREACERVKTLLPDIVVMDISMPDMNGIQATENIKRDCPDVKIMVLSAHEDEAYFRQMLRVGASGYLLKRAIAAELIHALQVVYDGGIFLCAIMAGKIASQYAQPDNSARDGAALSERESEVLRCIAWGKTNKEIAADLFISVKTVETHRARCMEKLALQTRADIVRYALAQGWLHQDNSA
jgi:DNA-binding NarL/FixJ family response regulator